MKPNELIEKQIKQAADWQRKADSAYKVNCRQDSPVLLLIKACASLLQVVEHQQSQINCLLTILPDGRLDADELRKLEGGQPK